MNKTIRELRKPRYLAKVSPHSQATSRVSSSRVTLTETMERRAERDMDKEYLLRALSHDVGAHLMLLEFSFRHYDELARRPADETPPRLHLVPSERKNQNHSPQAKPLDPVSPCPQMSALNEAASHVTACVDEMKRFVNELLSFVRTGSIDMEPSSVRVADLVDEVLFEQRRLIEKRNIDVIVSSPLPTVFANPMRIKQVLTNLIRNAAIHGCDKEDPMIVIATEWMMDHTHGHAAMVGFFVRDNGCGIPLTECSRIFEPGYRVPGNQNEGSGIGLAIVKKIACYYGGNVVCQSNGNGTAFIVTLPNAKSHG